MEAGAHPIRGAASAAEVDRATVATLVRDYLIASTAFFFMAGLLGMAMRQSQAGVVRIDSNLFYAIMTAHGLGAFVAWAGFAVMGLALWVLAECDFPMRPVGLLLARATFWFMVAGTLAIVVSTVALGFAASWVFLYPLPFHAAKQWGDDATALFSLGVLFAGLAIIAWCLAILHTVVGPGNSSERPGVLNRLGVGMGFGYLWPDRFPMGERKLPYPVLPLTVIAVDMIVATLPLAALLVEMVVQAYAPGVHVDPLLAKNVLWFFGHPVVYLLLFPAVAVYYLLIPRYAGRPLVAGKLIALAWLGAVIVNVIIWAHHIYLDWPEDTIQGALNTAMQPLTFSITLVSALSLYSLAATMYRSNFQWTPASRFLIAGLFGWLTAGLSGVVNATISLDVAVHNTLWIVGHFHQMALLNIGVVIFGAVYAFLPQIAGREWYSERLGNLHVALTLIGGYGMVIPWLAEGLTGAPRRFAVLPDGYAGWTTVSLPFIALLAIGQLVFGWNLLQTLRGRRRALDAVPARDDRSRLAWAAGGATMLVMLPVFILGVVRLQDNENAKAARSASAGKPAAAPPGRALFASTCGSCHALKAAGTSGSVGPNLDQLKPDAAGVTAAIAKGGTGSGRMPPGLLSGADAKQVADYVAGVAGR